MGGVGDDAILRANVPFDLFNEAEGDRNDGGLAPAEPPQAASA
jgi:hypothetical protein